MTKTQKEQLDNALRVAGILVKNNGYIKGYGKQLDRVMSGDHSPIENISGSITDILFHNNMIYRDGLIYKPQKEASAITSTDKMKLP